MTKARAYNVLVMVPLIYFQFMASHCTYCSKTQLKEVLKAVNDISFTNTDLYVTIQSFNYIHVIVFTELLQCSLCVNLPYTQAITTHSVNDSNIKEKTAQYQSMICSTYIPPCKQ